MKKIITLFLIVFSALFGIKNVPVSAQAADLIIRDLIDYNPTLQYYAILDQDKTAAAWIQNDTFKNDVVKNPIVFFNLNSATEIETITKVFFTLNQDSGLGLEPIFENEIVDENDEVITTLEFKHSLSFDEMHHINFYENYKTHWFDNLSTTYNQDIDFNLTTGEYIKSSIYETYVPERYNYSREYSRNEYHASLPELGEVSNLRDFYSFVDESIPTFGASMLDSFIYDNKYQAVNSGYPSWNSLNTMLKNGYTHYLILPIQYTEGVKVKYLAVEGYDTNGNFITPIPEVSEGEVVDPGTSLPETLNYVTLSKANSVWNTSNALFFGGNNVFKLRYIEISNLAYAPGTINYSMKAYLGNLLSKDQVSINAPSLNKVYILDQAVISTPYTFVGSANTLIIDANELVTSFTAKVYYEMIGDIPTNLPPIMINLIDENGELGISGLLPEERPPVEDNNWWAWLSDLFGFKLDINDPFAVLKAITAVAGGIIVLVLFFKILGGVMSLGRRKRR